MNTAFDMSSPSAANRPPRTLARQLALGFGLVSLVAMVMGGVLLVLISEVSSLVGDMRHDEAAIRQGLDLAAAIREQYIHIAHSVIEADGSHLEHYDEWRERVVEGAETFMGMAPQADRWRLDELVGLSLAMDESFREQLLPAVEVGDANTIIDQHRLVETWSAQAAEHADVLARAVESRMTHAHTSATRATRVGLVTGGLCALLVVALSVAYNLRLRSAVLRPLEALSEAARRFGSGDFKARLGHIGRGELQAVAIAFDHMAEELMAHERLLVQSERMAAIGQLAAGVAHEMNNPIGIIRGYLKTMSPESDPATLREELQILDEEAAQCQRIAEDLLVYARMPELRVESVGLHDLLEESARRLRGSPETAGVAIEVRAQNAVIRGDATRLRQLIANLVVNACQASPNDAVVELIGTAQAAGGYEVAVCDRGPGISTEKKARIFEPFYSSRPGGTGLGLAICQGIASAHGGGIAVEDRPGGGSTFRVRLHPQPPSDHEGAP